MTQPLIVALGGTLRADSATERCLRTALVHAEALGATTELFDGPALQLPLFPAYSAERTPEAERLVAALRRADGGYGCWHGW